MRASLHDLLGRRRTRWLLLAAAVLLIIVGAAVSELLRIRRDLDAGRAELSGIDLSTVDERGGIGAVADRAADRIDAAADRARSSPVLRLLRTIPVVGTQIDAVRDITGAAAELADHGRGAAAAIEEALAAGSGPEGRLTVVRAARAELEQLQDVVDDIDLGADGWLLPPLHDIRRQVRIEFADARSDLRRNAELAAALEDFLVGPRRYLVLGGNNAEMRAVGIPTTSGIATIADGGIQVSDFTGVVEGIELPEPGVPVPLEYENLYGWLNGDRGYRTTLATANWPVAARISADITAVNSYGPVDGIIYVDSYTLEQMLSVIGPVEVNGTTYDATNVLVEILYRNYLRFGTTEDIPERTALQSQIATTIFDELEHREYPLLQMAGLLSELARGRHLLAWAEDPGENALWEAVGADGRLRRDGIAVISEALNASKLDFFVSVAVEVEAERVGDTRRVTLRITIANSEHPETSPYIDGGGIYADPGEYGSFLLSYLPQSAYDITSEAGFTHHGRDGPMYVAGTILRVPEAEEREVVVEFSLPAAEEVLTVIPSARLAPTEWRFGDTVTNDRQPFTIDLSSID